jgi:hypothetical protein
MIGEFYGSCSIPSKDVPYINNFDIDLNPFFLFLDTKKEQNLFGHA